MLTALSFALAAGDSGGSTGHVMRTTRGRLLNSLAGLLAQGVALCAEYNDGHRDFPLSALQVTVFMQKWTLQSLVWSFGGSLAYPGRLALCATICASTTVTLPAGLDPATSPLIDYQVVVKDQGWHPWREEVPELEIPTHRVTATDVVIPTVDTVRHRSALRGWLAEHRPLILCGPPGSGKTMTLTATLQASSDYILSALNFSSQTTPGLILKVWSDVYNCH